MSKVIGKHIDIPGNNYIIENEDPSSLVGWTVYANTTPGVLPDDFGGTPNENVTFTINTTNPLSKSSDFKLSKDANNRQGHGVYFEFDTALTDRGKVLAMIGEALPSADYDTGDITFSLVGSSDNFASDIQVKPGSPQELLASLISGEFLAEAQIPIDSTKVRFCIHIASTNADAWSVQFTRLSVGPQLKSVGAYIGDVEDVSGKVSLSHASGGITNYTLTAKRTRVGPHAEYEGSIVFSNTSAAFTDIFLDLLDVSIDSSKLSNTYPSSLILGEGRIQDPGVASYTNLNAYYVDTQKIGFRLGSITTHTGSVPVFGGALSNTWPMTFGSGDSITFKFRVPIAGWGSTQVLSSEASRRTVTFKGGLASNIALSSGYNAVTLGTVFKDSVGGWDGNGYTIKVPGDYIIGGRAYNNESYTMIGIKVSGGATKWVSAGGTTDRQSGSTLIQDLKAGDTIRWGIFSGGSVSTTSTNEIDTHFWLAKVDSGSQQIAASETIAARAYAATTTNLASTTNNYKITLDGISHDLTRSFSSSRFTAPESGLFSVKATATIGGNGTAGSRLSLMIYKNGSLYSFCYGSTTSQGGSSVSVSDEVPLLKGEYVELYMKQENATDRSTITGSSATYMSIVRVGNYA